MPAPTTQPRAAACLAALALATASASTHALSPAEVFEKVAPSVWAVRGLDSEERPFSYGSAVVIGPGSLVTNCHVLAKAKAIQVRRDNVIYEAKLAHADVERDLCILSAEHLSAPAVDTVALDEVKVGQRVYAIGNPEKLALTLSEGLISGMRSEDPRLPPVQTSAPISPGSSGGGLFDERGRLVGITTLVVVGRLRIAQNLNFAMPAEWIGEVPERAKEQLAKRRARSGTVVAQAGGALAPGLPAIGSTWKYSYRDRHYNGPQRVFTVALGGMNGEEIQETTTVEGGAASTSTINAKALQFYGRRLVGDTLVTELSPYIQAADLAKLSADLQRPQGYPAAGNWTVSAPQVENDEVVVGAGSFRAVKVVLSGTAAQYGNSKEASQLLWPVRFRYTAWYAPQVNRYVQIHHETWNKIGNQLGDEFIQLLEYKRN